MKIISKFKDYYDYISHVYGEDPKTTYVRNEFDSTFTKEETEYFRKRLKPTPYIRDYTNLLDRRDWTFKWLVFCGRYILLVNYKMSDEWKVLTKEDHPEIVDLFCKKFFNAHPIEYYVSDEIDPALVELSRKVQQPVFIINEFNSWTSIYLEERIPVLADIAWFPKNIKPEQAWQQISHFLTSVLRENPDTSPPVEISDKDKISKAGFDLKASFRHRKD